MIYIFLYSILAGLSILCIYVRRDHRIWIFYIGVFLVLLFQSLRWRTGTDWTPYFTFFKCALSDKQTDFEGGYIAINQLIRYFTDNYTAFLFFLNGLNLLFISLFVRKMPMINPMLCLLYFFSIAVFPIRYTLASSIILYSYTFILKEKFWKFTLCVIVAFLIHRTAIIFLPLYFISRKHYSIYFLGGVYVSAILLGLAADYTFGNIFQMASSVYNIMGDTIQGKMNAYITDEIPEYAKMSIFRYCLSLANSTLFITFFYYFKKKFFAIDNTYNMLFNLYLFGISFNRIFVQVLPDLARLTSLFTGGFIIMIIMIINRYKRGYQVIFTIIVVAYLIFNYKGTIYGIYEDLFIPYYSVFDNVERIHVY